ncbi:ImmA/IrrE family metallo-endopeptidase [Emticicia sp. W12TSBA100-4]|uniref:ImmA/IrrE family metallo-endopeptidase n=1 Tax=Emticicia sp. W12TSBA100-4 TaxID=3160965 RepID=UPI003305603E
MKNNLLIRGFKAEAERKSLQFRQALGLKKYDKLCAFELAKHLGVRVLSIWDLIPNDGKTYDDWSALLMPNHQQKPIILHNPHHSEPRRQSDIMHELAHFIQKHPYPSFDVLGCLPKEMVVINPIYEEEAKWLGAALQIPKDGLIWTIYQKMEVSSIANHFNASLQMVNMRINTLGLNRIIAKP